MNAQLTKLLRAESILKQTKAGYTPTGPNWRKGMPLLWDVRQALGATDNGRALAEAHGLLKRTEKGYEPSAPRWKEAMRLIDGVEADLYRPPLPNLGPATRGGKPVLLESPTHNTDGLFGKPKPGCHDGKSQYAAYDFGWEAGLTIIAWEDFRVKCQSSAMGADAFYGLGASGLPFWIGHLASSPRTGTLVRKGEAFARIAVIPGVDHCHLGFDGRPLMNGHDFTWGKPKGRDYTQGGPTYRQQLLAYLEA